MEKMIYNGVDMTDIISAFNRGEISRRKVENQIKLMRGTAKPSVRRGRAGRGGGGRASAPVVKKKAFVPPLAGGSAANARELYRKRYGVDPPTHRE